ncbi:hypothetical protein SKAU_G00323370 [Synaphobranchus kaupii]|uniref:Uncharacterized protein n=1 Tax=Synaphobranchus kaupii TaxID=118154 RepID=A0A9Q1EP69_SYNKA|nr:hypothetical protein SKAU_G00323370 [Synaphobranchus kaupii]
MFMSSIVPWHLARLSGVTPSYRVKEAAVGILALTVSTAQSRLLRDLVDVPSIFHHWSPSIKTSAHVLR